MSPNYRTQMTRAMGSLNKKEPCLICCGRNRSLQISHIHLSTAYYNKEMIRQGKMSPMCYFCDTSHPIDHMTRQKVILATSTLSGVQFMQGWSWNNDQPTHLDMETIPGARIATLRKAWERAYTTNPLPIDTFLVAGLNDVKNLAKLYINKHNIEKTADLVAEDIKGALMALHSTIMEHSRKFEVDDTIAVSTILHTPSMYWHEDDGEVPTPDYINLKAVVDKTNLQIEAFNLEYGVSAAPKLHLTGERKAGKKRRYMWEAWREDKKEDMLHMTDPFRFKMTKCIIKYFEKATPKAYQHLE